MASLFRKHKNPPPQRGNKSDVHQKPSATVPIAPKQDKSSTKTQTAVISKKDPEPSTKMDSEKPVARAKPKGFFTRAPTVVGIHLSSGESDRLKEDKERTQNWKRWGPYLSERQWSTVREDYSPDGSWFVARAGGREGSKLYDNLFIISSWFRLDVLQIFHEYINCLMCQNN